MLFKESGKLAHGPSHRRVDTKVVGDGGEWQRGWDGSSVEMCRGPKSQEWERPRTCTEGSAFTRSWAKQILL